jgi:hydroxyisourate hydrolase
LCHGEIGKRNATIVTRPTPKYCSRGIAHRDGRTTKNLDYPFQKLLTEADFSFLKVAKSPPTFWIRYRNSRKNISIRLQANRDGSWQTITQGITNADGRIPDLLPPSKDLKPDSYKMVFDTGKYYGFANQNLYPKVEIIFETFDETHYHVPLLVNPFGYSTYRGS